MNVRNEVKSHLVCEGVTMQEVLEKIGTAVWMEQEHFPICREKLHRETLRYKEAVELADVLGIRDCMEKERVSAYGERTESECR